MLFERGWPKFCNFMYQNKTFTHIMLYYQTAQKSIALYDESDLSVCKMKMFDKHFDKKLRQHLEWESH